MFHSLNQCACCGGENLVKWLDLGFHPSANAYHHGEQPPKYPLEVNRCLQCSHSQLSGTVNPDELFQTYLYCSGTSETFRKHCMELATDAVTRCGKKHPRVLDVACNDGTAMECFRLLGCDVVGIDPAQNLWEIRQAKGLHSYPLYWSMETAAHLFEPASFDIITATNVLGHVREPKAFLDTCAWALKPDGLLVTEFPYGARVIQQKHWDFFYGEHVSLFTAKSFDWLVGKSLMEVEDVKEVPIHGGSLRSYLRRVEYLSKEHPHALVDYIWAEQLRGLHKNDVYERLAGHVEQVCEDLRGVVERQREEGRLPIAFGASAKLNTVMNAAGLDLLFVIDENPLKQGYLTPGRNVPIVAPEHLRGIKESICCLLGSWNFRQNSVECLRRHRSNPRDLLVSYVPSVKVEAL